MPDINVTASNLSYATAGANGENWIVNPNVTIGGFYNTAAFVSVQLTNKGAIVGHHGSRVGMMGDYNVVWNQASGLIFASTGPAVLMDGATYGHVSNDGQIISTNGDGVWFAEIPVGGRLVNTGTITSDKKAAVFAENGTLSSINNSGNLFGYEGIVLAGMSTRTVITNTGRIEVDLYAIRTEGGNTFSLDNSGVVDGIISARTSNGADSVTNSGQMLKNVVLAGGNDTYIGTGSGYAFRVYGEGGFDKLTGSAAADTFYGGSENDILNGGGGNDRLMGETGVDRLTGGAGNDVFIFAYAPSSTTRGVISDFNVGNDTIHLENAIFTKVGAAGALKAGAFALSTATKAADDRIIYNKVSGALSYDSDGSGAAAPIWFASVTNKPVVTAADFLVI